MKQELESTVIKVEALSMQIKEELKKFKGSEVLIISNYNGQEYGRSKKSLKGTIHKIESVHFDGNWWLFIEGYRVGLGCDEVEFISNQEVKS